MSGPDRRLAGLSAEARAQLFERLRAKKSQEADREPKTPRIVPRDRALDPPPLSFAQQRLWFLDRLRPGDPVYNIPSALRVTGPLDPAALRRALAAVVARHESLRTTFGLAGAVPVQVIAPAAEARLLLADLTGLAPADCQIEGEIERLCSEEARRPFDLAAGPLLRVMLLRLSAERHVLLFTQHHIVSDGWSSGVLSREVMALYSGAALPELPVQYADFAVWQRQWLTGETLERQVDLWRRRLTGAPAVLDLPTDRPRPALRTTRGSYCKLRLPTEATARLKACARGLSATPFTVLLAAWQALLHRVTGQEDLCVAAPVANRDRRETAGLIGFFVNTLVLRGDLSGDPGFRELVARLREVTLEAFLHQDLPFEKLVEELRPERNPGVPPLAQVSLNLLNTPRAQVAAGPLQLDPMPTTTGTAKYDLTLTLDEFEEEVYGWLFYSADLFDAPTAARLASSFEMLVAAAEPGRRLSELPLLSAAEHAQIEREWNDTRDPATLLPFHQVFAQQAQRTPDAVAVESREQSWTYRELDALADRLAGHLQGLGAGPDVIVAIQADRSLLLVLAVLAVLKAGGAYLPLDPAYPRERRSWMLEDARAAVLLCEGPCDLPFAGPVVRLGEGPGSAGVPPALHEAMVPGAAPGRRDAGAPRIPSLDSLAYVIYTSGSTGAPKGVLVPHRGLANLAARIGVFGPAGPGSRILLFASPGFDASLLDLVLALGTGAMLCLAPARELPRLGHLLYERDITHLHLPPSALAALVEGPLPSRLRCLILGGEPPPEGTADRWGTGRRLFNDYGPTEATVFVTVDELRQGRLTTGRPIGNVEVHVLDRRLRPVPVGVPGEVCLGGDGVARGYLGNPAATAERFVPHHSGARLYRTGDLGRWLPDGSLVVLGRIDGQVKVRGFRVEPEEVEAALRRHPAVQEAAVVVREGSLVAFVVTPEAPEGLRGWLREMLPAHMVPASVEILDRLPLNPHGKVDRRALAGRPLARAEASVAPRSELEATLASLWAEVLGLPRVGVEESFFDLGGHSLLLARLQTRLAERLAREVPLLVLFEHTTVGALAAWLEAQGSPATTAAPAGEGRDRARRQRESLAAQRQRLARRGETGGRWTT